MKDYEPGRTIESRYACGYCNCFAIAVHEITGWPIYMIAVPPKRDEADQWPLVAHVFVVTPDGLAFDVRGAQRPDHFMLRWFNSSDWADNLELVYKTSKAELVKMSKTRGGSAVNPCTRAIISEAKDVAMNLLKRDGYGPDQA